MEDNLQGISFIVITKNEEFAVKKCLDSLKKMKLEDCEIICVDSGSSDNTLEVLLKYKKSFNSFHIFCIKGYANAAIGRNIGFKNSTKNKICFIDGDIALSKQFLLVALKRLENNCDAVTGQLAEIHYSHDYNKKLREINDRTGFKNEEMICCSVGTFLIKSKVFKDLGGFDEKFENSQDIEFHMRLVRKYNFLGLPIQMGVHHTIPYDNLECLTRSLKRFHPCYSGMIIRRNIRFPRNLYKLSIGMGRGTFQGLAILLLVVIFTLISSIFLGIYLLLFFILVDVMLAIIRKTSLIGRLVIHYIAPLYVFMGLFFDLNHLKKYNYFKCDL